MKDQQTTKCVVCLVAPSDFHSGWVGGLTGPRLLAGWCNACAQKKSAGKLVGWCGHWSVEMGTVLPGTDREVG